jgi:CheY-like chemotaxis protein
MQTLTTFEASSEADVSPLVQPLGLPPTSAGVAPLLPVAPSADPTGTLQPILVAEDDEDDVFFIQRLIKKTGTEHPIKIFDDGSEVVNYLGGARLATPGGRLRCPRLLFLDLNMRGLGGFGFLEWARQQQGLSPLTIVVLSNSNEPEMMQRALELGAHRYLVKYPSIQTMTTIVRSVYPQTVF